VPEKVTLNINGSDVKATKGNSVLEVALSYGICIPHLCHVRTLLPSGACRLCIVELEEHGRTKVTTSCTLEAREGMIVRAHTERIMKIRRNIAEMLVAEAPNSRAVQDVAVRCGVTKVRYPFRNATCIQCGRCTRACDELWQAQAKGFVGRGKDRRVDFPFSTRPDSCKLCYACIDLCPMSQLPCGGYMEPGKGQLCGKCESQLSMCGNIPDACVDCRLGDGFDCVRKPGI